MLRYRKLLLALALMMATPGVVWAQATDTKPSQPEQALLKPEQLDALVAPIALYPDALLANLLAASTYPLEVVQADRWLQEHKKLKDEALKTEIDKQGWDESVKALAATPTVLAMMSEKLDWTKALGDAVLAQQPDVMDAIQRLRAKAHDNKKLVSTKEQKVTVAQQESKQVIVIEPTDPNTVYVPYYEPAVVYGEWPYPAYPPYYFAAPPYIGAGLVAAGLAFGAGFALGRWGNYWGGGCNWGNNNFFINRSNTINNIGNNWQHNPSHRQGVRYNNANVQQKFGNNNLRAGASDRMDYRGRDGKDVLNPGKDRAGAGDRAGDRGGADRAGVATGRMQATAPSPLIAPRPAIAPRVVIAQTAVTAPREVIGPRRPTAAAPPVRATRAEAKRSGTCRRGERPTFSPRAAARVLPARAPRGQTLAAVAPVVAAALHFPVAAAAVAAAAVAAAEVVVVAADVPISR